MSRTYPLEPAVNTLQTASGGSVPDHGAQAPETGATLFELASRIEPDASLLTGWWREDGIEELGGLTAGELIRLGRCRQLRAFLVGVLRGSRG